MKTIYRTLLIILVLSLAAACSPKQIRVESFTVLENRSQITVDSPASREELLVKIFNMLKKSENLFIDTNEFNPETKKEKKKGIRWYVQGGPIPAFVKQKSVKFADITYLDRRNMEIRFQIVGKQSYLGIPVFSAMGDGVLKISPSGEIKISFKNVATWMVIGTSVWNSEWTIDYIDLDNNILGAYWAVSGGGPLCAGNGSGYLMAGFVGKDVDTFTSGEGVKNAAEEAELPALSVEASLSETSGNRILEGGEELSVSVTVNNTGKLDANGVKAVLSGSDMLIKLLGRERSMGSIKAGKKGTVMFKAQLPPSLPGGNAEITVDVVDESGYTHEKKVLMVAMRPAGVRESVEILSELPRLEFSVDMHDANGDRVLEGGEKVSIDVEVANRGDGVAGEVIVQLSGGPETEFILGGARQVGVLEPGAVSKVSFESVLPQDIPWGTASLRVEVLHDASYSAGRKVLKVAMKPKAVEEVVEILSEVNVDDIPGKASGGVRKDDYAIVIGIGNYREKIIPPVKYARRDAEVMSKYLENLAGIPRENIKLLVDDKATKSDLVAYTEDWLARRVKKESTVYLYYAGHGVPDPLGAEAFIVPYEGHPDFPSKLYPLKDMYEILGGLPAERVIVMLDSCFSGADGRGIAREGARPMNMRLKEPENQKKNIVVMTASSGSQISSDYDKVQHGLFTYYLLRGIRGEADEDDNGIVGLGELYGYVRANVAETASLKFNRDQVPAIIPAMTSEDYSLIMLK